MSNAIADIEITDQEFNQIRSLVYDRFGITLNDGKRTLVVGRLQKLLKTEGIKSYKAYYDRIIADTTGQILSQFVDRMTTNYTYFNREKEHFEFFSRTALPNVVAQLKPQGKRDLRLWCAACSTGEEPYMLAMLMRDFLAGNMAPGTPVCLQQTSPPVQSRLQRPVSTLMSGSKKSPNT